ncbi:hypothetical protein ACFWP3_17100 [Streptomyces sp. NPDC058525]|uniref:hypothetical protein n=1 Tax=Streptomyces sp. NPDC058525 TaxID=3346538 RepID=UPI00364F8BEF
MSIAQAVKLLTARPGSLPRAGGGLVPLMRAKSYAGRLVALQRLGVVQGERRPRMDVRVRYLSPEGDVYDDGPRRMHLVHHIRQLNGPVGSWALGTFTPLRGHGHQWRPLAHAMPRVRGRT